MNLPIHPSEPEINKKTPWIDDALQREECAKQLTQIIKNQSGPLTISVNGSWGTGKTFLLKRWKAQLELDKYKVIYFNAWEDDFLKDPLLSIIGQLFKELPKDGVYENIIPAIQENAISIVMATANIIIPFIDNTPVIKPIIPVIGPIIALLKSIWNFLKRISKHSAQKKLFDEYGTLCESKIKLTESLEKLADTIHEKTERPLIFIIDELDRCRPTYAIETLERIKHLFHIKNMIFVLGIARESLEESIQSVYGQISTFHYLLRFIDIEFNLPITKNNSPIFDIFWKRFQIQEFIEYQKKHWNDQIKKTGETEKINHEMIRIFNEELSSFKECFYLMLRWHEFTLREIEQCMKLCALALQKFEKRRAELILIIILIVLKIKFPKLYIQYLNGESTPSEISNKLIHFNQDNNSELRIGNLLTVIIYATFSCRSRFYEEKIQNLFNTIYDLLDEEVDNEKDIRIFNDSITSDFLRKQCETQIDPNKNPKHFYAKKVPAIEEFDFLWRNYAAIHNRETAITKEVFESITKKIDFFSTIIPTKNNDLM